MSRTWLAWALALAASGSSGCSSAAEEDAAPSGFGGEANGDSWDHGSSEGGGSGDGAGGSDGADDGGQGGGDEPPPRGDDDGTFEACPSSQPGAWVFCEDFETIVDPSEVMLDYQDRDGAFVLVDGIGASGDRSMEVRYRTGEEGAGWMVLSFGRSPLPTLDHPTHAPDASFEEIYWRLRVKMEPDWPDVGPGQLTRTVAFAGEDWSEAVVAHLRSASAGVALVGVPVTCVTGTEVDCSGYDDQAGLESLGSMIGRTPLFSASMSGQWHCVEGHLELNTPGTSDGTFEFWIDDRLEAARDDLDLRGSWTDYGINALVVENLWPGGAPAPLRRWIDDLVISTERIGCTPGPEGEGASAG
ncbi:hypothetical protein [Paraliomyxa miuraensis]|uniref:hypothetical protein n=1 Tax=Paraliomyxa miuraensis TaxID=376150 RepID=UPI00224C80D1|nr:hypothetical protein [Paraliomyxa miuraensis]MCX4241934.1 hypothetical protein [Paraliomyxa miuraensis]